mgnify:CR=1 FL=1
MEITATQLATIIRGEIEGDGSVKISSYSKIEEAQEGSLSFLANPKGGRPVCHFGGVAQFGASIGSCEIRSGAARICFGWR